ncbi:MAG: 3-dehydroquinate synthase [Deltaproteobacteria bacterium]|nr:3-dehydroquinate synthase [Deltaproteobacteria bacterium]
MQHATALVSRDPARIESPSAIEQRFSVAFDYPVAFTRDMFAVHDQTLVSAIARQEPQRRHRLWVVVDAGVARAWPDLEDRVARYCAAHHHHLDWGGPLRIVPGGEAAKNEPGLITALQREFFEARLDRHSTIVVIGGGAVLDAVGYAAAVTHRGLRIVRVPTTVLAQNDAGIGVKNGVNRFGTKNALGCFSPPFAVINDLEFISTLSRRERIAGIAEAVKVALIRDHAFFGELEANAAALREGEREAMQSMIRRGAALHLAHIRNGGDPFESGSARPLDFGHWAAHRLEVLSGHSLRHGEAVGIGIAIDCGYSALRTGLPTVDATRVEALLAELGLPLWHEALDLEDARGDRSVLAGIEEFREHLGGPLTVTMLETLGKGIEVHELDRDTVSAVITALGERRRR